MIVPGTIQREQQKKIFLNTFDLIQIHFICRALQVVYCSWQISDIPYPVCTTANVSLPLKTASDLLRLYIKGYINFRFKNGFSYRI